MIEKYNPSEISMDLEIELEHAENDVPLEAKEMLTEAKRACAHDSERYSPDEKIRAAIAYSLLGSVYEVARELNIPHPRIRSWMKSAWWPQALAAAKAYQDQKLHSKITTLQHTLINKLMIAIETDPVFVDKKGDVQIGKHSLKDLSYALSVMGGQKTLIEQKTRPLGSKDNTKEALSRIAKALEDLGVAQEKHITIDQPVERVD